MGGGGGAQVRWQIGKCWILGAPEAEARTGVVVGWGRRRERRGGVRTCLSLLYGCIVHKHYVRTGNACRGPGE